MKVETQTLALTIGIGGVENRNLGVAEEKGPWSEGVRQTDRERS